MLSRLSEIYNSIYNKRQIYRGRAICGKIFVCGRISIINFGGVIRIGNDCMINSGRGHNPIGGDVVCRFVSQGGEIDIGNRVGISNSTFVSREHITIEDDVFIGGSCKIYDNDFHPITMKKRIAFSDEIPSKPVLIKKGAFVGAHTIILKGTTIGEGAIIGAGSVVSGNVPTEEVWAGNPARFIKKVKCE